MWRPVEGESFSSFCLFLFASLSHLTIACPPPTRHPWHGHLLRWDVSSSMAVKAGSGSSHGRYECGCTAVGARLREHGCGRTAERLWSWEVAPAQEPWPRSMTAGLQ